MPLAALLIAINPVRANDDRLDSFA
jgi:hypothetical protein